MRLTDYPPSSAFCRQVITLRGGRPRAAYADVTFIVITSTLECDLGPHCERIELRARVAEVGGANLLGNVAVKEVEHQANVAIGVPVQCKRIDRLPPARGAAAAAELL